MEKLEDDLRRLQSEMQKTTLDCLDLYGKAKKLFGRVAKAQERADAAEESETPISSAGTVSTLSPRARLIQNQILQRRASISQRTNGGE